MKNLLLVVAFMLSIGAFAQDQTYPRDPNLVLCDQVRNFEPKCLIEVDGNITIPGVYDLDICLPESWSGSKKPADLEKMIQEYICLYNNFPDYVNVRNFRLK